LNPEPKSVTSTETFTEKPNDRGILGNLSEDLLLDTMKKIKESTEKATKNPPAIDPKYYRPFELFPYRDNSWYFPKIYPKYEPQITWATTPVTTCGVEYKTSSKPSQK